MGLKTLKTILVCSLIVACTPGITPEMAELCKKRGGFTGSKNVESVAGVYFAGSLFLGDQTNLTEGCGWWCNILLLHKGYSFVEVGLWSDEWLVEPKVLSEDNAFEREEFYRLSISEKGSPQCEYYRQLRKVRYPRVKVLPVTIDIEQSQVEKHFGSPEKCIGMQKIESPTAKFGIKEYSHLYKQIGVRGLTKTGIWLSRRTIFRLSNSQTIAMTEYFANKDLLFPSGVSTLSEPSAWCPIPQETIPVELVIPPTN